MPVVQKRLRFVDEVRHGGRRRGAGRKRLTVKRAVPHRRRRAVLGEVPIHLTMRVVEGMPNLRDEAFLPEVDRCFEAACLRDGFRITCWTMQSNHFHLIVEASDRESLTAGIKGLKVRLARAMNRFFQRTGQAFAERCHEEFLTHHCQARHCVRYVLENAKRHSTESVPPNDLDPFSSAHWFDGWRNFPRKRLLYLRRRRPRTTAPPVTRLLRPTWRSQGTLAVR